MIHDLKIAIKKKQILDKKGHYRFYPPTGKGTKAPMIYFDKHPELKTEQDLIELIYNNFGEGEYLCIGYAKGHRGCWAFWKGEINKEGFIFHQKKYDRKEVEAWNKDLLNADDTDEKNLLEEIRDEVKKEEKVKNRQRRYGFEPFLKKSSNRGEFRFWEDDKLKINENNVENKNWASSKDKINLEIENKKLNGWGNLWQ